MPTVEFITAFPLFVRDIICELKVIGIVRLNYAETITVIVCEYNNNCGK
jgi:hypothetical protein